MKNSHKILFSSMGFAGTVAAALLFASEAHAMGCIWIPHMGQYCW